jgi:predicted RNA-binding protein with PIN domain
MSLHFILDGYNLIKKIPEFSSKKIRHAREDLIRLIEEKRLTGSKRNRVTVVFDGYSDDFSSKRQIPFEIIFAKDADEKIRDIIKKVDNPKEIVVITDDRQLQDSVRLLGAKVQNLESFLEKLKRPKAITEDLKLEFSPKLKDEITEELKKIWLREDDRG